MLGQHLGIETMLQLSLKHHRGKKDECCLLASHKCQDKELLQTTSII
jgi:hypothetical protein